MSEDHLVLFRRAPKGLPRRDLRQFATALRDHVAGGRGFCCLIADDAELLRLNRTFLGRDYPTDVLSFPSPEGTETLGDIAVSVDRAASQAAAFGHSTAEEIKILMLHGLLHLVGMDHERDRGAMARKERLLHTRFELPGSLIERTTR